jgi:general secretion pathway protein M
MKSLIKPLETYLSGLSEKDQRALKLLALFCAPLLVYFMLLKPSYHYYAEAKSDHMEGRELLAWMEQNKSNIPAVQAPQSKSQSLPLSQFVSSSAETKQISITRLQPQGEKGVRIWMNEVNFASLIEFLTHLSNNGFNINSITVDKTTNPGVVNAQCLIMS